MTTTELVFAVVNAVLGGATLGVATWGVASWRRQEGWKTERDVVFEIYLAALRLEETMREVVHEFGRFHGRGVTKADDYANQCLDGVTKPFVEASEVYRRATVKLSLIRRKNRSPAMNGFTTLWQDFTHHMAVDRARFYSGKAIGTMKEDKRWSWENVLHCRPPDIARFEAALSKALDGIQNWVETTYHGDTDSMRKAGASSLLLRALADAATISVAGTAGSIIRASLSGPKIEAPHQSEPDAGKVMRIDPLGAFPRAPLTEDDDVPPPRQLAEPDKETQ